MSAAGIVGGIGTFAEVAAAGYKVADEVGLWDKFSRLLRRKKPRILILGASGAGKTQFVESICNPLSLLVHERTAATRRYTVPIQKRLFRMVDTPGQERELRRAAIREATKNPPEGILNIVCSGYHEAAEAGSAQAVPATGSAVAKPDYLKTRQQAEINLLSEWVPNLDPGNTKWLVTVVNKADLWWPDEGSKIKNFYQAGLYASKLDDFRKKNRVLPYCSVVKPFYDFRTSGRFGDEARVRLRAHLLQTLIDLTES